KDPNFPRCLDLSGALAVRSKRITSKKDLCKIGLAPTNLPELGVYSIDFPAQSEDLLRRTMNPDQPTDNQAQTEPAATERPSGAAAPTENRQRRHGRGR